MPPWNLQSLEEALGEKFHINPGLMKRFRQGKDLSTAGTEIKVSTLRQDIPPKAPKIVVPNRSIGSKR